jgi:prepilin-type N-terminal cleavage/methylation domain-containing protein
MGMARRFLGSLRARLAQEERGMTLPEVLVSIVIFSVVLLAILGLNDTATKIVPKDTERGLAIREAQSGLDRMVRELRQAYRVVGTSPSSMQVQVRLKRDDPSTPTVETHVSRTVEYDCGVGQSGRCMRREAPIGQALPAGGEMVIDRILNSDYDLADPNDRPVFGYDESPNPIQPTYVTVRIEVPAKGERAQGHKHTIVLEDGFHLRNLVVGS